MVEKDSTLISRKAIEVKCPKCKHIFPTRSKLNLVSCNSCGSKFKREENIVK